MWNKTALMPHKPNYNMNMIDLDMEALNSEQTNSTETPKYNLPYRLHKAADIPFRLPTYLSQGLASPAVSFPILFPPSEPLPTANPSDYNRYISYFICR